MKKLINMLSIIFIVLINTLLYFNISFILFAVIFFYAVVFLLYSEDAFFILLILLFVYIPLFLFLYNTFLFDLHHRNVLGRHAAFAHDDIPDLGHLRRGQRPARGHHGQVGPPLLQKAEAVGKALGLDQGLDLVFGVDVLEVRGHLGSVLGLFLLGEGGVLEGLADGVQRLVVGLLPVETGLVEELAAGVVGDADQLRLAVVLARSRGGFRLGQQRVGHPARRPGRIGFAAVRDGRRSRLHREGVQIGAGILPVQIAGHRQGGSQGHGGGAAGVFGDVSHKSVPPSGLV